MDTYSVLIADDDEMIRGLLSRICEGLQWNYMEAEDGKQALQLLENHHFQICIVDVVMPGPAGVELAQHILQKEPTAAILILTGYAEVEEAVEAIKQGIFDYVQKHQMTIDSIEQKLSRAAGFHENREIQVQSQLEREKTLKDFERANKEFQAILDLSHDLIFIINAREGTIVDCNRSAYEKLGFSREALLSLPLKEIVAEYRGMKWYDIYQNILLNKTVTEEKTLIDTSQNRLHVDLSYAYVCLDTGEYFALIARDITERKENEKKIREHQLALESQTAILHSIVNRMDEGVILADQEDRIIEINQWILDLMQTPKEFLKNYSLTQLVREIFGLDLYATLYELKHVDQDNKPILYANIGDRQCMINIQAIYKGDEYQGVILNCHDISSLMEEQKKVEENNRQQLEELQSVSSDIQTPIHGILEMSKQLMDTPLEYEQRMIMEMIHEFGGSLSTLVESRINRLKE